MAQAIGKSDIDPDTDMPGISSNPAIVFATRAVKDSRDTKFVRDWRNVLRDIRYSQYKRQLGLGLNILSVTVLGSLMLVLILSLIISQTTNKIFALDIYQTDITSFDKQIVRNYCEEIRWDKKPPVPELPESVVEKTSQAYRDIYKRLTGRKIG